MVVGTTKTGEKVDLGTITIVGTKQSSYPSGGPTVPGSSTGIGSTFTPSQTSTYRTTTGGGSSSAPKPPQVYSSQLLQQNFTSAAERDKAENIYRQEQARQQQIAFSKTGGLVTPGQTSPYFKVRSQDVKTDSQAIRQAVGMADQLTSKQIQQRNILGMPTGKKLNVVEKGGKTYAPVPGTNIGVEVNPNKWKGFFDEINVADVRKNPNAIDINTGQPIATSKAKQAIEANISGQVLREDKGYEALSFFVGGGGAQASGLVTNVGSRVVSKLLGPTLVSAGAGISGAATKVQQLFNPFGQTGFGQAGTLVIGGTKASVSEGTKQVVKEGLKFGASQVASGTGYFLSSQAPDAARQLYDTQNPDKAKKFSQFETQQDYDIIARSYTAMQVEFLGGQKETSGYYTTDKETKQSVWVEPKTETVQGKVDPLTGSVYQAVPVTRLTNPDAVKTWEKRLVEEYKEDPRYQALSANEKKEFIEYKKGKELAYAQAGGFVGQVGTEISSEIGASGAHSVFFDKLSGGQASALRSAGARIILTLLYGTIEGGMQPVLEASSERRVAETNQILYGMGAGAVTSSIFAGVPEYLRVSAKPGAKTAVREVAETVGKKTTKKTIKETSQSTAKGMTPAWLKNIAATGTEYVGYALDPLEKVGDWLALPAKKGIGVSTITITPAQTLTSTSVKTQTDTKTKTKTDTDSKTKTGDTSQIMTGGIVDVLASVDTDTDNKRGRGKTNTDSDSKTDTDNDDGKGGKTDTDTDSDTDTDTTTGALTGVNTLTSTAVIVPQRGFGLPGFFPIGMGARGQTRQQTRIYDELAAAGKRFEQISGLPFTRQPVKRVKPKSVLIDGKKYKIGKRLFK